MHSDNQNTFVNQTASRPAAVNQPSHFPNNPHRLSPSPTITLSSTVTTPSPRFFKPASQPLVEKFRSHLIAKKSLNPSSIKNYLSDINQFLTWLSQSLQEPIIKPQHITAAVIKHYQQHPDPTTPITTINRRLSSLRRFGHFLLTSGLTDTNPCSQIISLTPPSTQTQVINQFKHFLNSEQLSPSTVKNYLSDLNQYLLWATKTS